MRKQMFLLLFISGSSFAQTTSITGWQEQKLFGNPSKVSIDVYEIYEKFGEQAEKIDSTGVLTFNKNGNYLTIQEKDLKSGFEVQKNYTYEDGSGKLSRIKTYQKLNWDGIYFEDFEWSSDVIFRKIKYGDGFEFKVSKAEYEYDNEKRVTTINHFDKNNNVVEIWKYLYKGKLIIDFKKYDNMGKLFYDCKYQYDIQGNLLKAEEYEKSYETMKLRILTTYIYNSKNDIIEKNSCIESPPCYSIYYNLEYYPNGLLKKRTEYYLDKNKMRNVSEIVEYKIYDKFNNWTERIIWSTNHPNREILPSYKYIRVIEYY